MGDPENRMATSTKHLEDIAQQLLQSRFILTALELHVETTEAGTEIQLLRDYFSNPSNFELCSRPSGDLNPASSTSLNRSSSQTTLDSLDWARYSEDGERILDDKIAVLEFELRKAKETIQALRDNLTQATATAAFETNDSSSLFGTRKSSSDSQKGDLKPHEACTLNFLVNEYLVTRNYKMTANTFADENDNQDFENWDDVGLNIPRPPPLVQWLQEKLPGIVPKECALCQTDLEGPQVEELEKASAQSKFLEEKVKELESRCERQELELQKLHRKMSTPHITPLGTPHKTSRAEFDFDLDSDCVEIGESEVKYEKGDKGNAKSAEEDIGEKSTSEMVKHLQDLPNDELNMDYLSEMVNDVGSIEDLIENPPKTDEEPLGSSRESVSTRQTLLFQDMSLEEKNIEPSTPTESMVDIENEDDQEPPDGFSESNEVLLDPRKCDRLPPLGASSECSPQGVLVGEFISAQREEAKSLLRDSTIREVPQFLETQILGICFGQTLGVDSRLQNEVASLSLGQCDLLDLVSSSLHNIAPNVILAKREELLPLLVYSISQHSESKERERLLHLLFNLTKKPDKEQRGTILLGLVNLARVLGPDKLEAELLPQCWEQLSHKHTERRLLVAQSVAVLAPYTAPPLRNSLLLSMVQQVLGAGGEKEACVREAAMASLALLTSYLDDEEKIPPLIETLILCLQKIETKECKSVHQSPSNVFLLLSSLAYWSIKVGSFSLLLNPLVDHIHIISREIAKDLVEGNKRNRTEQLQGNLINLIKGLEAAAPFIFLYLHNSCPDLPTQKNASPHISSAVTSSFIDELSIIFGGREHAEEAVWSLHNEFSKRQANVWPELSYICGTVLANFAEIVSILDASSRNMVVLMISFVSKMCAILGPKLTKEVVSPLFLKGLVVNESDMESIRAGMSALTKATLVVYVLSILSEGDHRHKDGHEGALQQFLSRQIAILAISGASMESLQLTILLLMEKLQCQEEVLGALWASVVHRSPRVRAATAPLWVLLVGHIKEADLSARVIPALVTIATDPDVTVRSSAIMPLSFIVANSASKEVKDKVLLQLESVCEEAQVIESPALQVAIAQTCSSLGHNTPSLLLHKLFLPCLCRSALEGAGTPQEKMAFGTALLEALTALASSPMPDHLVAHFILPPLNQLQKTLGVMSFEHMETITVLTKEYTLRAQSSSSSSDRLRTSLSTSGLSSLGSSFSSSVGAMGAGLPIGTGVEDVKNKMTKMFSSTGKTMSSGFQGKGPSINLPTLFKKK